jgi:hypothetical protein
MREGTITHDEDKLQEIAEQWQTALRLRDWDIEVHVCRVKDMGKSRNGEVHYNLLKKHAVINVLDPRDYKDDFMPQDQEYTVVHEMLHLHFAGLDPAIQESKLADLVLEQGIHACATLMTELLRAMQAAKAGQQESPTEQPVVTSGTRKPRRAVKKPVIAVV